MKKIHYIALAVLIVGFGLFYLYSSALATVGNLNIYNGNADILRSGKTQAGKNGSGIKPKDVLKVHTNSRVAIILNDDSVIRLEAGTEVEVKNLDYKGKKIANAVFELKTGRLWSSVKPLDPGSRYEVETPTILAGVRGTSFNVDYTGSDSKVFVSNQSVSTSLKNDENSSKTVRVGEIFSISNSNLQSDFSQGPNLATPDQLDDWIKYNIEEDKKLGEFFAYSFDLPNFTMPSANNVAGTYEVEFVCSVGCSETYNYFMTLTNQSESMGYYFTGTAVGTHQETFPVSGFTASSSIQFVILAEADRGTFQVAAAGTIEPNGNMSGSAADDTGKAFNWKAVRKSVDTTIDISSFGYLADSYTVEAVCTKNCSGSYPYKMTIRGRNPLTGFFNADCSYPDPSFICSITGNIVGNKITMRNLYTGASAGYYADTVGTIASDGTITGTTTSSSGQELSFIGKPIK